jgi:hypothetical protein
MADAAEADHQLVITVVSYSDPPSARLIVAAGPNGEPAAIDIPVDDLNTDLRQAPQVGGREVLRVEVGAPSPLLQGGLAFVDTPGVGGHGQPHLSATRTQPLAERIAAVHHHRGALGRSRARQ